MLDNLRLSTPQAPSAQRQDQCEAAGYRGGRRNCRRVDVRAHHEDVSIEARHARDGNLLVSSRLNNSPRKGDLSWWRLWVERPGFRIRVKVDVNEVTARPGGEEDA